jgi:hypothetical protein
MTTINNQIKVGKKTYNQLKLNILNNLMIIISIVVIKINLI